MDTERELERKSKCGKMLDVYSQLLLFSQVFSRSKIFKIKF